MRLTRLACCLVGVALVCKGDVVDLYIEVINKLKAASGVEGGEVLRLNKLLQLPKVCGNKSPAVVWRAGRAIE